MVDGSIGCAAIGDSTAGSHSVSATVAFSNPATATMSPASASSTGCRSSPRNARILLARPCSMRSPVRVSALIGWFAFSRPDRMRPVSRRPR